MDESIQDITDDEEQDGEEDVQLSDADEQAPVISWSTRSSPRPPGRLSYPHQPEEGDTRVMFASTGARAGRDGEAQMSASVVSRIKIMADLTSPADSPGRPLRFDGDGRRRHCAWSRCPGPRRESVWCILGKRGRRRPHSLGMQGTELERRGRSTSPTARARPPGPPGSGESRRCMRPSRRQRRRPQHRSDLSSSGSWASSRCRSRKGR